MADVDGQKLGKVFAIKKMTGLIFFIKVLDERLFEVFLLKLDILPLDFQII